MADKKSFSLPGDRLVARKVKAATENAEAVKGTQGNFKRAGGAFLRDMLTGAGGAIVGAFVGRPSLALGTATTLGGYLAGSQSLATLGLGMMLASGFNRDNTGGDNMAPSPTGKFHIATELKNGMTRVKNLGGKLSQKLWLDKLGKKSAVNGLGFSGDPYAALDQIEAEVYQAANDYDSAGGYEEDFVEIIPELA